MHKQVSVSTLSMSILFGVATLHFVVSFHANMTNCTSGKVSKCLAGVMAGATEFSMESFKVFTFDSRVVRRCKFGICDMALLHNKNILMAGFTGKFLTAYMNIMGKNYRLNRFIKYN